MKSESCMYKAGEVWMSHHKMLPAERGNETATPLCPQSFVFEPKYRKFKCLYSMVTFPELLTIDTPYLAHNSKGCGVIWETLSDLLFSPRPVLASGYRHCLRLSVCVCVRLCVSVNPKLVHAKTHHTFKLEPPNLDKRCKKTWLRSLLFWGVIALDVQGKI